MSVLKLKVTSGRPNTFLVSEFQTPGGAKAICQRIVRYLERVMTGGELAESASVPMSIHVTAQGSETAASGTLTFVSAVATNTFSINGTTFTAVASGASGNQFNIGGSDTLTAAAAAAAINASATALVSSQVVATSALGVVTVTSLFPGVTGNQATLAGGTNITASGARLTGGVADSASVLYSF